MLWDSLLIAGNSQQLSRVNSTCGKLPGAMEREERETTFKTTTLLEIGSFILVYQRRWCSLSMQVFSVPKSLDKRVDKGKQSLECGFSSFQVMLGSVCEWGGFFGGVWSLSVCESGGVCVCVFLCVLGSFCL